MRFIPDLPNARRTLLAALSVAPLLGGATAMAAMPGPGIADIGVTPEQFGARGDGTTDDAPALQRALDALAGRATGGILVLQPTIAYRCDAGLLLDASYVSCWGQGLLDFSRCRGTCLRVTASSVAPSLTPANNYGHRGMISGALRLRGGGVGRTAIGIQFDSDVAATAAQLLMENVSVSGCTTGIEFARRAYNNVLVRCDIFDCDICVRWRDAEDNGERNTLIGCALYNSGTAVRMEQSSGAFYLNNCSVDYTRTVYDVARGMVFATDCHHESDRWTGRPFRCVGDGAVIHVTGGIIVGQADPLPADFMIETGEGASARLDGVFLHNIILATGIRDVAAWATGAGNVQATRCETFDLARLPIRLHAERTCLSDPDFRSARWEDVVWRPHDAKPITDRYGTGESNLRLAKGMIGTDPALIASKAYGHDSGAAVALITLPVQAGQMVLAGFHARRDPRRLGNDATLDVSPTWMRIDGMDEHRVPVVVRSHPVGTLAIVPPADRFVPVSPLASRSGRTAPSWATHFAMVVDLSKADQASFFFNGLWADAL